jgi:hypothetical protein
MTIAMLAAAAIIVLALDMVIDLTSATSFEERLAPTSRGPASKLYPPRFLLLSTLTRRVGAEIGTKIFGSL